MQVTLDTPARLVLEEKPWLLGAILIVGILVLLALAMGLWRESLWLGLGFGLAAGLLAICFVIFVRRVLVIFDRAAGVLVIRSRSLTGQEERTLVLAEVTGAEVETSRSTSSDNDGHRTTSVTHRPVLSTRSGPVPLIQVYNAGSGAGIIAEAVNRWLADQTPPGH